MPQEVSMDLVADYMVVTVQKTQRPRAVLASTSAAVNSYFKAIERESPIDNDVFCLIDGLVKSGT